MNDLPAAIPDAIPNAEDSDQTVLGPAPVPVPPPLTAAQDTTLPPGTRLGEFEIQGVLGIGGFGIVYLALDHSLGRQVALKEFMPTSLATRTPAASVVVRAEQYRPTYELALNSFVNEARLLAQFDHPALVKVHRFWRDHGTAYMVMPYYKGQTLRDHLRQQTRPIDEAWLAELLRPLLDVLENLHGQHCYHRDIAPDNILLLAESSRPRPLLLDFGAARRVISDMTQALTAILKPGYAPIEQYADIPGLKQGPWTDLYALAATIHFAITGAAPAPSVARMVQDQVQPLARVAADRFSVGFLQALDRALSVRPEQRPQSVAEFRAELGLHPVAIAPPSPASVPAPPSRRLPLLISATAALALLLGTAALWRDEPPPPPSSPPPALPLPVEPTAAGAPPTDAFDAVLTARSPAFDVQVRTSQPSLRIGKDRLAFTVESAQDGHVYVIAQDPDGARVLLFPNSQSSQNRLRAGQPMKLPQSGWPLVAEPPAGQERLLVIVARTPRDYTALSGARAHWFSTLPAVGSPVPAASPPHWLAGTTRCQEPGCGDYGAAVLEIGITP